MLLPPVDEVEVTSDDLIAFAGNDGMLFEGPSSGIAGQGEKARLEVLVEGSLANALDEVRAFVADQASDGQPVFVRIPFANDSPVVAVVSKHYRRGSSPRNQPPPAPRNLNIVALPQAARWRHGVERAVRYIKSSDLTKVVLSRQLLVTGEAPFSPLTILRVLRYRYPSAYCFVMDGFIGASPELVIARSGTHVSALPMAGTVPRGATPAADAEAIAALEASTKDRTEHRILIDDLTAALLPFCSALSVPESPEVVTLANVHHFVTPLNGELEDARVDALTLLGSIHPTPAVGGHPTAKAVAAIAELEQRKRGYYGGAIGWVDASGDGSFAISLRCAQLRGHQALLSAGAGIVADSDPFAEERETDAKFKVMLEALST